MFGVVCRDGPGEIDDSSFRGAIRSCPQSFQYSTSQVSERRDVRSQGPHTIPCMLPIFTVVPLLPLHVLGSTSPPCPSGSGTSPSSEQISESPGKSSTSCSNICVTAAFVPFQVPIRFTSMIFSAKSAGSVWIPSFMLPVVRPGMPALFTMMSNLFRGETLLTANRTASWNAGREETSSSWK